MVTKKLTFGDIKIEKKNTFYHHKVYILLEDVDLKRY